MSTFWWNRRRGARGPQPHECEATRRLSTATRALYAMAEGGQQNVMIGKVLSLLDPGYREAPPPHPLADPITGAMPVDPAAYGPDVSTPGE